nr:MAG TPA: hypothetical protein [Caudoviricetes sp.]
MFICRLGFPLDCLHNTTPGAPCQPLFSDNQQKPKIAYYSTDLLKVYYNAYIIYIIFILIYSRLPLYI